MGFLKLYIGLILATVTVFCITGSEINYRLPKNAIPVSYNISLIPHVGNHAFHAFHGDTSVIIDIVYTLSKIRLHSQELKINETATTLINSHGIIYRPIKHINDSNNILTLDFDNILPLGLYTLNMKFDGYFSEGNYHKSGFMQIPYTDMEGDRTLAATLFQPNNARRMFPCWDEPAFKATFNISVIHHKKYRILSNWPIRKQHEEQNDMVWTSFDTTPVMSTYLVGIVILYNFIRVENTDKTVNVWCQSFLSSQTKFAHTVAEKVMPFLLEYNQDFKKIPKIDYVVIPNYPVSGMEAWGLIIFDESKIVYDESTDPTFRRREVASLVTNKLVHYWFGNYVTPSWWSHLWLSEGFSAFFEAYFLNKIFGDWRTMDLLVIERLHHCLSLDIGLINSVTLELDRTLDYDDLFYNDVFNKASAIMRMLHHAMGDEIFRQGVTNYLVQHPFGSVTPDDLWSAMQSALQMAPYVPYMQQEDFKIKEVMDTWINQNRYPVLNVTINYETGEVAVTQKCFRATECTNNKWWIPMTYADQSNLDFSNTMPNNWLGPDQTSRVEINTRDWIIVNVQQTAYCRVYYDTTNMERIIRYLNSEEYKNIHVLNRAQMIDDAFAFLMEDQLDNSVFKNLINYLRRERDYVAWRPMFRILERLSKYFSLLESKHFKSYVSGIFDGLLQKIGYEENPNDDDITKMLRLDATKWACTVGHAECKRRAAVKLTKHLADPNTHKVPHWWQDWTYCFGLTVANITAWNKVSFAASQTIKSIVSNVYSNEQISKVKKFAETNLHQDTLSGITKLIEKHKNHLKQSIDIFTKYFGKY
ncbi:puromycin-sensitive aminopeptidase-like protein [Temnothorax curvispinosus]|uniref:Aminopeptidase n=1 Tax=Temnothorax curvispinosus TaxID=300111 RepID=A0A6J1Q3J3_9HYME|nr:puromycin-sensitive aminopeptidase-like protein [Temnothorax curvispinosus]